MKNDHKHILLCVAGMTPQIITETLFALTQQEHERVDEIRVITTLKGQDRVVKDLLDPQTGQFIQLCRDYHIDPSSIKFDRSTITVLRKPDGENLDDLRLGLDNEIAANLICEIVRELAKQPKTRIHASAAGGRKTMGLYLMAAMQLFGRPNDRLSHVLVSEEFEGTDFYYKPPINQELTKRDGSSVFTDSAKIDLTPIPFIRLRGARSEWLRTSASRYVEMVVDAQEYLDLADVLHDLQLDSRAWTIQVENRTVKLSKMQYMIYALFADLRKRQKGLNGFVLISELGRQDFANVFHRVTAARGNPQTLESPAGFSFLDKLVDQAASKRSDNLEDLTATIVNVKSKIARKFEVHKLPERYHVTTRGDRKPFRYGLNVDPSRIVFLSGDTTETEV